MEDDLNLKKMEDDLNFKANGRQPQVMLAQLALASPEPGTAQPEIVTFYYYVTYITLYPQPSKTSLTSTFSYFIFGLLRI